MGVLAISHQSFWIDEALTGLKARQTNLTGWWRLMSEGKDSDLQMPLYMIYVWGWAKIFGASEWALRAANLPWFAVGVAAFIHTMPRTQKLVAALVILLSPFAWYYLDEARPYAMQLGASLMIFAALYRLRMGDTNCGNFALLCFGLVALAGSSLLGMIWSGAAVACVPMMLPPDKLRQILRSHLLVTAGSVAMLLAIAIYYVWTLQVGARASPIGITNFQAIGYIVYELLGFAGLGPGRLEIREGGLGVFAPFAVLLAVYGVSAFCLFWSVVVQFRARSLAKYLKLALAFVVPIVGIIAAGMLMHFRVLARHFMPLLPVLLFVLSLGVSRAWLRVWAISRLAVLGFFGMALVSCLEIRFAARHERDDYRDAAALANRALHEGKVMWWSASRQGAEFYRLPIADRPEPSKALNLPNPQEQFLDGLPTPDVVIASKSDVYDEWGAVAGYLKRNRYSPDAVVYRAFTVWERKK